MAAVVDMLDLADPLGALEAQHHTPEFSADASWYWRHRVATAEPPPPDSAVAAARRARKLRKAQHRADGARKRKAAAAAA